MKRTMTARSRLGTWANVSRQQTDEETYGLCVDSVDSGGGSSGVVAGSGGVVAGVECADGARRMEMNTDPLRPVAYVQPDLEEGRNE